MDVPDRPRCGWLHRVADQETDWRALNRRHWDERVPLHLQGTFYNVADFQHRPDVLRSFEVAEVGDVSGKRLLHLQCHLGLDTLSWAGRGASVVGVDFSEPAVRAAQDLADNLGISARFVAADVYDTVEALNEATFDVVYTGIGALCWLPDLSAWAQVVRRLLAPDGFVYLAEFHPFTYTLDDEGRTVVADYFNEGPHLVADPGSYASPEAATRHNATVQYQHRLGTVVSAIASAGLRLEFLHEHDLTLFPRFTTLVPSADGFRLPADQARIPLMYSLRASAAA